MIPTKEWVEKVEALGIPWGLFFSITPSSLVTNVLEGQDGYYGNKRVTAMGQAIKTIWTVREVIVDHAGNVVLRHHDHSHPRPSAKCQVFIRDFTPHFKYFVAANKYVAGGKAFKKLDYAIQCAESKGLIALRLLLSEHGTNKHDLMIGLTDENDAIILKTLVENT